MGTSPTPPGLIERIMKMVDERISSYARSGFLRNASITDGGLTIKGGFMRLVSAVTGGADTFYVGPVLPKLPDGSRQPGVILRREDGTAALAMYDPDPASADGFRQFLALYDRAGHIINSDDTSGGEGGARPWIPYNVPKPTLIASWPSTAATTWGLIAQSFASMERPKVHWSATAVTDAGVTGQVRLNINNGAVFGPVHDVADGASTYINDVIALPAGFFGSWWSINVEAQVTGGAGSVHCQTWAVVGRQS